MYLPVYFTDEIRNSIESIKECNQNNERLYEWKEYLEWIVHHLSNSTIAWDYSGKCRQGKNGIMFFDDVGYSLNYIVKIDKETSQAYVSIIYIDLKPEEFGLRVPFSMWEDVRKRFDEIISETIHRLIRSKLLLTN